MEGLGACIKNERSFCKRRCVPRVTESHKASRRSQILEAARNCFTANGFHETTVDDICRLAGLSAGAVYGYFRGKAAIVEAMADESLAQNTAAIRTAVDSDEPLRTLADLAARSSRWWMSRPPGLCSKWNSGRVTARGGPVREPVLRAVHQTRAVIEEALAAAQASGQLQQGLSPRALAELMTAMITGRTLLLAMDEACPMADYARAAAAAILGFERRQAG